MPTALATPESEVQSETSHAEWPDYTTLRDDSTFNWRVASSYGALLDVTGIPIRELNLDPDAGIELYRKGRPILEDMYGPEVSLPRAGTPHISYGHVNGLGSKLTFPEGGEVAHEHICGSLEEGIEKLKEPVDYATAGMAPFFMDYHQKLKKAFPDENVSFHWGLEGPLTTAYELRGDGIFYDLMDDPDRVKTFLSLVNRSIIEFRRFTCGYQNVPAFNKNGGGMCDDIASMVPPRLFPEIVVPAWEDYYRGLTSGKRNAHVEDLRKSQLIYLEKIGLWNFDPSVSPKLNPRIIRDNCRVKFSWRLCCFHYPSMSVQEVRDFVFQSAVDGASGVHTIVANGMCNQESIEKVHAFIEAGKEVKKMLAEGATRASLRDCVSESGRRKFWDHWPE